MARPRSPENLVSIFKCNQVEGRYLLDSRHIFFSLPYKIETTEDTIIFSHVDISFIGKSFNQKKNKVRGTYRACVYPQKEVANGTYPIDEELTNEDTLVVLLTNPEA